MQALIVHAHPEPTSFTALKDTAVRVLSAAGHRVEVSDLYGEGFNPVAGRHDFINAADPARFHYQSEQLNASQTGGFAAELVEQDRLMRADLSSSRFHCSGADCRPSSRVGSTGYAPTAWPMRIASALTKATLSGSAQFSVSPPAERSSVSRPATATDRDPLVGVHGTVSLDIVHGGDVQLARPERDRG